MTAGHGLVLAVSAGVCAASASLCAKLAMSGDEMKDLCSRYYEDVLKLEHMPSCHVIATVLRVAVFALVFVFNGLMWTLFTKSLQLCRSSLHATMTNSSSNLIFSGIMGKLLFGEKLSLWWWFGVSLIILGLLMVNRGQQTEGDTCSSGTEVGSEKDSKKNHKKDR
ncbi:uncharacterized protein [Diadema antillarum]|uniref:uncharacterized protein n=1 Tax=Diadema antillarum TaxID=105358 RepID=UPI003A83F077